MHTNRLRRPIAGLVLAASLAISLAPTTLAATPDRTYGVVGADGSSAALVLTDGGIPFRAVYPNLAALRAAILSRFHPTDPCRVGAAVYNGGLLLNSPAIVRVGLGILATYECTAVVGIDTSGTITSFQPVAP